MIISILLFAIFITCSSSSSLEKTTIKYWSMWNKGEPQQVVIQKIIDEFEDANPNVKVDVQWMGREVSKVRNAALSGDTPDLTEQSGAEVEGTLINNKLGEPLNDLLSRKILNEGTAFQDVFIDDILP